MPGRRKCPKPFNALDYPFIEEGSFNSLIQCSNSLKGATSSDSIESTLTNQPDLSDLLTLQKILYSDCVNVDLLKTLIEDLKKKYSSSAIDIDHQLILAFSLDYTKIPILIPFLSKKSLNKTDFIHADQEFLFRLIEADISFPLIILFEKCIGTSYIGDDDVFLIILFQELILKKN